jgi:hypothetical protein
LATEKVLCPSLTAEEVDESAAAGAGGVANAHCVNEEKIAARERT